ARPAPPAGGAGQARGRLSQMIEPVMAALTTWAFPEWRTKSARISSAALPKVTFSRPPTADPADFVISSVARRIQSASGTMAAAAGTKTPSGGGGRYARPTDSGTSSNKYVKIIRCSASLGVSYGHDSFLDNERYASPARPTPARASQPRWVAAHSWALRGVARRSNTPCAPWSPGTGSH